MSRDLYLKHLGALQALDQQIGELAAYVAEIADALTDEPGVIVVQQTTPVSGDITALSKDLWPTFEDLSKLLKKRRRLDLKAQSAWAALARSQRARLASPLKRRGLNRLKPLL